MGRKVLSDVHRASPVLFKTSFWDFLKYFWAIWAIFSILAISMTRSKNIGNEKGLSSSMKRAVEKKEIGFFGASEEGKRQVDRIFRK